MKIELVKEKLQKALTKAGRLTSKHLSLPILSHILLVARRNSLTLRATNLDMGVEYTIPARVEKEGVAAAPAGVFTSFIATLPGGVTGVSIEGAAGKILISTPVSKAVLPAGGHDDFPTIPKPTGESFTLGPEVLREGFKAVQYAGAPGNLKPELGSVHLHCEGKELVFAATDSFRLAEKKVLLKKEAPIAGVLVPLKNAAEFVRLLEDEAEEVALSLGKGQLSIETRSLYATSRLVEGTFPDYRQIIPTEAVTEATLLKEDLLNALKVATLFSDRFNQVRFHSDPKEKLFELITKNGDIGESTTTLPASLKGEPLENNFNYRYISDCLGAIGRDSLSLRFSGEGRPLLISGVGDATFRYLVMPMNR